MFSFVRAAALAAALLGTAFAPNLTDPAHASGLELPDGGANVEASYVEHISANLEAVGAEGEAGDAAKLLAHDVDFSHQVAQHAVATSFGPAEFAKDPGALTGSLASLVDAHAASSAPDDEMECLAGAIYFESKGEPLAGQLAVAEVIINRTRSGKYPTSLCGVVKQPSQFSFVRGGRMPRIDKDSPAWRKAVAIAHIAQKDLADSPVPSAISFHATYVSPRWRMTRLARVGRHIFYR